MDLRRIRHFNVLAETLNFSRAAERLHIAQPALSVSIQKLETELGTRLFERTPSGVVLTAGGQAALVEARRLLYHGEQLLRTARDAAQGTGGRLRVGFVGSAIYRVIPALIPAFRTRYPGVELILTEETSTAIVSRLNEEALDIGIVRTPLLQSHGATLLTLQRDRFVAALPKDHPLAARDRLHLADLAREPFVMYSPQQATQVPTVVALVEAGLGVALVPEVMRGHREPQVAYRDLQDTRESMETTLAAAWMEGAESPAAQRFIEVTRRIADPKTEHP